MIKSSKLKQVAVIGAGASGLIASYFASEKNNVILFEKQKKIGRKILITGNGRCNITNSDIGIHHYHGKNPEFVHNIFSRFGLTETIDFFNSIGIPFIEMENGKMFPASLQAGSITKLLKYELKKRSVDMRLHRRVDKIIHEKNQFKIITAGKENYTFDSVILSAGSCAYSPVGASNYGYDLAESLGHKIHTPFPVLLPINIQTKIIRRLQGIKWDSTLKVKVNGKNIFSSSGELLFTAYGISGPVSLDISRSVNENILNAKSTEIIIDLFPEFTHEELQERLNQLWADENKNLSLSLLGILKERMPEVLLELSNIDHEKDAGSLTGKDKKNLVNTMKGLTLTPGQPRSFSEAVVAAGGVDVSEVNPGNMESKLKKNLFITGELLDIDGDSGGYNLQFAWSTGAIAGMSQGL